MALLQATGDVQGCGDEWVLFHASESMLPLTAVRAVHPVSGSIEKFIPAVAVPVVTAYVHRSNEAPAFKCALWAIEPYGAYGSHGDPFVLAG